MVIGVIRGKLFLMELYYKEEAYQIVGICMEIHRILGHGFSEIVYKDAIEYELINMKFITKEKKNMSFPIRM